MPGLAWQQQQPMRQVAVASWDSNGSSWDAVGDSSSSSMEALCRDLTATWCCSNALRPTSLRYQSFTIKDKPDWKLVVSGTIVNSVYGPASMVVCLAADFPGLETDEDGLSKMLMHWGCSEHAGWAWRAPPVGWHAVPQPSKSDAPPAWQTPFKPVSPNDTVHMALLQLPIEEPLAW